MRLDIAIVTHQTDAYLHNLLASIRDRLPTPSVACVHVFDNASADRTGELLRRFSAEVPWLRVHRSPRNLHHGPALDFLLRESCGSEWVLLLDSDTEVLADFTIPLGDLGDSPPVFIGQIHPEPNQLYAYLCHLLVHRPSYLRLPPLRHDGAPGLDFFRAVAERRLPYRRLRWRNYVRHYGHGTLREIHRRGETTNPFFTYAEEESSWRGRSEAHETVEATLRRSLADYLEGRPAALRPDLPCPREVPHATRSRRLVRGAWALRTARRLGLEHDPAEIRSLYRLVRRLRPRCVLEIGTSYGGSLFLWTSAARADATLVSVDLPPWELDDPWEEVRRKRLFAFAREGQLVRLVRKDSHDPTTLHEVKDLFQAQRIDFLFLDGDDSYEGIARDFADYAPLVRPGGLVAMAGLRREGVARAFREVRAASAFEIREGGSGIGIIPT
jgi:predicted O-methyltransferase YrrM